MPYIPITTKICDECVMGKQHKENAPKKSMTKSSQQNELIHTDICGSFWHLSLGRSKYFITFTYHYSQKTWTFFLPLKSWAFENFKAFKMLIETWKRKLMKVLQNDRGGEFLSRAFNKFYGLHGKWCGKEERLNHFGVVYVAILDTPHQNSVARRTNQTILDRAQSMAMGFQPPNFL